MKTLLVLSLLTVSSFAFAQWHDTQCTSPQLMCVAASGTNVFAGAGGGGVYYSTDEGDSWSPNLNPNGFTFPYIWSLRLNGADVFAATMSGIYISTDGANYWNKHNNGLLDTNAHAIAINGTNIFAGTAEGGVFLSTDYATTWTAVNTGLTSYNVVSLAASGTNIFAGTSGGGVFLSTNNGGNWTAVNNGLTNGNIRDIAFNGGDTYVATSGAGVFKSSDNGGTWVAVTAGMLNLQVSSLIVENGNIFAGTEGGGVYLSTNNGSSWTAVNDGLTNSNISDLAISDGTIYASTYLGGLWRRDLSEVVGVEEVNIKQQMGIYPNPFSDETTISLNGNFSEGILTIYNSIGKEVRQQNISSQNFKLQRKDLPAGFYLLRITQENNRVITTPLIISD